MNQWIDGEDFYATIVDMGEKITFLTDPQIIQYASITPHRTTNTTDGAYWYTGAMTFNDVDQQNNLLGEYFIRQTNPKPKNILTAVMPENTTAKMATVYSVECNETVDIISHYEDSGEFDKYGDPIIKEVYLAKNVSVYMTMVLKPLESETSGAFIATMTNLLIPAKYKLSSNNIILKKSFVFNEETKQNELSPIKYKVESIDTSMMDETENGIVGILRCLLTEDKR